MKRIRFKAVFAIVLTLFLFWGAAGCKKDRSMSLTVTVKMMADTSIVVPNAKVTLEQGSVLVEGYTDGHGEFRHVFNLPVQLNIRAEKDSLKGVGIVNLGKEGVDYYKSVFIF